MKDALVDGAAERAVLGAILTDPNAFANLRIIVGELDFAEDSHQRIWRACCQLADKREPIDHLTVAEQCKDLGLPVRPTYLMELDESVPSQRNAAHYAGVVVDRAIRRRFRKACLEAAAGASSLAIPLDEVLTGGVGSIVAQATARTASGTLADHLSGALHEIARNRECGIPPTLPTGIARLDSALGGLQPLLNVIGGRPGAGKSAVVATITQTAALAGTKVGVFSLEDRAEWLAWRLLSAHSGVPNFTLRFRKLKDEQYEALDTAAEKAFSYSSNILVDDRRRMTAGQIVQSARAMVIREGAKLIIIDHLGEVHEERRDRHDLEVAAALAQLRDLSNELTIPVIVCAHLSRKFEEDNRPPRMADFKNAGAIEEMARVALAVTRKEDTITFHVLKNTNGSAGFHVDAEFIGAAAMVRSVERPEQGEMGF